MAVPAPTPFQVSKYSTDSAGTAFGTDIILLLHDYFHAGSDDISLDQDYIESLIGVMVSIVALGVFFLFVIWCFNCCACCSCCRKNCCTCLLWFDGHKMRAKIVVIGIFVMAAIVASTSYAGRGEFNDAIFEIGDQMRYVANIFDDIGAEASSMVLQGSDFVNASASLNCANSSFTLSFQSTSDTMVDVAKSLDDIVGSIADDIRDQADVMEEEIPPKVDMAMMLMVIMVWFNVVLGSAAVMTNCKCDDCLVILIGSITILILTLAVGAELTLATFAADFCYAVPEDMILDSVSTGGVAYFYLTCNGTSPFASGFDDARDTVSDFDSDISAFGDYCDSGAIERIGKTSNQTVETITNFEALTGCSVINPIFTNTVHGIFCDEFVKGLFITFMVQAASAVLLFFALMFMPCAASASRTTVKKTKVAPDPIKEQPDEGVEMVEPASGEEMNAKDEDAEPGVLQSRDARGGKPQDVSMPTPAPPPSAPQKVVIDAVMVASPKEPENAPISNAMHEEQSIDDADIEKVVSF